jgi:hypothetical protein
MNSVGYLRERLDRARARLCYARKELERFYLHADMGDQRDARTARKLEGDVEKAEMDVGWASHAIEGAFENVRKEARP